MKILTKKNYSLLELLVIVAGALFISNGNIVTGLVFSLAVILTIRFLK